MTQLSADAAEYVARVYPRLADDPMPRTGLILAARAERARAARVHGWNAQLAAECADNLQARADLLPVPPEPTRDHVPFDGFGGVWNDIRIGRAEPDEYCAHVIRAMRDARAAGLFYNSETYPRAAAVMAHRWGYADVRGSGDNGVPAWFGSHCYMADDVIREQAAREARRIAREALQLAPGTDIGSIIFSDGKLIRCVTVESVSDSGESVTLAGKRGATPVRWQGEPLAVQTAIDRAHQKGKRRTSSAEFCAARLVSI